MEIGKQLVLLVVLCTSSTIVFGQQVNNSLLSKVAKRFEQSQHLTLEKIITPTSLQSGQIPEIKLDCYSGKQVTIVAIFDAKPIAAYGRMLVTKYYEGSTKYDEHFFQQAGYEQSLKVNYALISVYFPPEATYKNCNTLLQVYDKKNPDNKVWLIVLTK